MAVKRTFEAPKMSYRFMLRKPGNAYMGTGTFWGKSRKKNNTYSYNHSVIIYGIFMIKKDLENLPFTGHIDVKREMAV